MTIDNFRGDYAFLSNFYPSVITVDGVEWRTVEHFYQAMKTFDTNEQNRIRMASKPSEAKRLGASVTKRSDWEIIKTGIMLKAIRLKFSQNAHLRLFLLSTSGEQLVEGNTWHDNIWGQCWCYKCRGIEGQNLLGKILMLVRDELNEQVQP